MPADPVRVILDCDTTKEVDDQFAIAYALGLPTETLDVRGVVSCQNTTAHGPASRDMYQEEAERVVALCGGGLPCVPGAARPMENRRTPVGSEGLDFLVEEARRGPLSMISTGPATDAASLFLVASEVMSNVQLIWLGGFGSSESYRRFKFGELNGRPDIAAWRVLLEAQVDLLQVPGCPGPAKVVVRAKPYAENLRALGRPVTGYLAEILVGWGEGYEGDLDPRGEEILWDVSCVATVADPGVVRMEEITVPTLDAAGAYDFSRRGRTVDTLVDVNAPGVLKGLWEALMRLPVA